MSTSPETVRDGGDATTARPVRPPGKTGFFGQGNQTGEIVPGWTTIMRPLKRKSKAGSASGTTTAYTNDTGSFGKENELDRKNLESAGSQRSAQEVGDLEDLRSDDELLDSDEGQLNDRHAQVGLEEGNASGGVYKVYKRRWFGLVQLVLLNIVVSWDWLTFSANSTTSAQYFNVSETKINWISTAFLFSFVVISPLTIYILHRGGPKPSIVTAAVFLLLGNWIRYGSTRAGDHGNFGGVMFGQILTGFAQPFVLAAPTRYSDLWFTNRGRVAATAIMSLANPFGGALAQLIGPFWATDGHPEDIPNMVLYVSIIATIAALPAFFIPAAPPTPSSASSSEPKQPLMKSLKFLFSSREFYMIMLPFVVYVGLFNSISSLINQMLAPYGFSETDAGIAGAILIVVGLVMSAITSPIIDKTKAQLLSIKICVPIIAASYLAFTWAPGTRSLAAVDVILAVLGAASFSLVPVVLEYLIEITHPVSPEVTSTICWSGGQLTGGIFILISDALRDGGVSDGSADDGTLRPPGNLYRALIFQTVMAMIVFPLPLALGLFGRHHEVRLRRVETDRAAILANAEA